MAVNLSPIFNDAPYVDSNGNPFSGALLYTYTAGSSTPQPTFTAADGLTQNDNPMTLNAGGYPTTSSTQTQIWLTAGVTYKFELKSSGGTTIWTRDNIDGINDTSISIDQWVSGPAPTYIGATSFSLVGDQTTTFHVGRRLKTTNSGGTIYSTITASTFGAVTTITVVNDSGSLDAGLSAVSYGLLSYNNPSAPNNSYLPPGVIFDYAGSTVPTGWLECDGSSVLRATYAALFSAISTTWGAVDGTHFTLPDFRSKSRISRGTGTSTEAITNSAINTGTDIATVVSNSTKWITGMQILWNVSGTPPTTSPGNLLDDGDTVYIIRNSATEVKFATSLANAQNGTAIDITNAGSGTFTMTHTYTARTLGEYGGEEAHAMSLTELIAHTHVLSQGTDGFTAGGTNAKTGNQSGDVSQSRGGNAAMNIMQPFAVTMAIIKT